jgi:hypothetical protein
LQVSVQFIHLRQNFYHCSVWQPAKPRETMFMLVCTLYNMKDLFRFIYFPFVSCGCQNNFSVVIFLFDDF